MNLRSLLTYTFLLLQTAASAQSTGKKLADAYKQLIADEQAKYATTSLCVLDAKTGKTIFAANENVGMATASTLKTITAATAFYKLGADFRYETKLGYNGTIDNDGTLNGDIIIIGAGDPTLGSWRFDDTKATIVLSQWIAAIKKAGIKKINGGVLTDDSAFGTSTVPQGWIWQDIGNYYGAGGAAVCWRENQFDVVLKPGSNVGAEVKVIKTDPEMPYLNIVNELKTGSQGSGDNAYGFLAPYSNLGYLRGTWGIGIKKEAISLSLPDPAFDLAYRLQDTLTKQDITFSKQPTTYRILQAKGVATAKTTNIITTTLSPKLADIVYWFQRKSINLYGEQLLKTIAYKEGKEASTKNGTRSTINFWTEKNIDKNALNMIDGSGLSPGNRVTSLAMASILYKAQQESWFPAYLKSFPEYNGMTIKSGNINDVTAYAGYYTAQNGSRYIAVISINNYSGSGISKKLFKVLDALK